MGSTTPPKNFPAPGEYRGIGADGGSVAQVQPLANSSSIATAPLPTTPMIQSPNSTTTQVAPAITPAVGANGTALPTSQDQAALTAGLNLKSKLGNIGAY